MDERQIVPRAIPYLLETGQAQLCRLLDKTPPSGTPPEQEKRIFNAIRGTRDAVIGSKQSSGNRGIRAFARV